MHVDALTLAAMTDELRTVLTGARIEDVIQPTPHAIALQCWGGGRTSWLLASSHPQLARVHLVERKPQKLASEPPPFVMLLRKHLEGARIVAVEQPRWERVVEIACARGGGPASPPVRLVVEIMGRLSNILLRTDDGVILGALRLVSADVNRYRTIAPNEPYRPPPPQTRRLAGEVVPRLDGERVVPADLRVAAEDALGSGDEVPARKPPRVAGLLAAQVLGFSQELGREVAARALHNPDAPLVADLPWDAIADETRALASLFTSRAWRPTLVLAPAAVSDDQPIAYAAYEPRQYAGAIVRDMPGISAALDAYYRRAEWRDAVEGAKADLRRVLQAQRERCVRKSEILSAELASLSEADRLRAEGEALLTFQSDIPARAVTFTVEHPFSVSADAPAQPLTIALDPRLTAVENANRRFARYHKLRRAAAAIPPQQAANAVELARLDQLLTDLALADTTAEIAHVRAEVAEAGYLRRGGRAGALLAGRAGKAKPGKGKSGKPGKAVKQTGPAGGSPLRRQSSDGLTILVGKNSQQNEEITFRQATSADLWLHARGVPGAHVIVKSAGRPVPDRTLREAAALAARYSQAREDGSVPVDYTEQRHVRHMKGGGPGMVIYERERTVRVAPRDLTETGSG